MGPSPRQGPLTDAEMRRGTLWLFAKQTSPCTTKNNVIEWKWMKILIFEASRIVMLIDKEVGV
jgi:hypothetical protein